MTRLNINWQGDIYRRIATPVGRYVSRTNEGLSLAITKWVTLHVVKEFYSEGCTRGAVQTALNKDTATTTNR